MRGSNVLRIVHRAIEESPRLLRFETRIEGLETRIEGLETRIERLHARVEALEATFRELCVITHGLREETGRLGILWEDQQSKMDRIMDAILDLHRKFDHLTPLPAVCQRLQDRQDALDDGFRKHVRNRRVHRSSERQER